MAWCGTYKLDENHHAVPVYDTLEWGRWFETADRIVMQTHLIDGSMISTVFLGIDHSFIGGARPVLFETALRTGEKRYCEFLRHEVHDYEIVARYSTWAEAEVGHMAWIEECVPKDLIEITVKEAS